MYLALPVDIISSRDSDISVSCVKILDILDKQIKTLRNQVICKQILKNIQPLGYGSEASHNA